MEIDSYESVKAWREDYIRTWGSNDPELPQRLRVLEGFCAFVGKDPDAMVAECLREVDEGKRIRAKARRRYMEAIRQFEEDQASGRTAGNVVRGFFIHNGIAMSADVLGVERS